MTQVDPNDRFIDITPSAEDGPSLTSQAVSGGRRKRGRWILLGVVALGGTVLAGLAMTGGRTVDPDAPIPTIRADDAPVKVRPDQPGGMEVPNQDKLIYGRLGNQGQPGQVERLLPPPEVPLPPPAPAPAERAMVAEEPTTPEPPPPPNQIRNAEPGPKPAEPPPQAAPPLPVQTVTPVAKTEPATAAAPAAKPAAAQPVALPATKGSFLVQLGALKDEKQAEAEWGRIKRANEDLLGGLTSDVMRADLGAKGIYFRLRAGPLASEAAARDLCAKLAQRKTGCIVVRP